LSQLGRFVNLVTLADVQSMKIPFEILLIVIWPVATVFIVASLVLNDVIIRDVCRREGRNYSIFWLLGTYWHWRIFKPGWWREAEAAGYLRAYVTVCITGAIIFIFICVLTGGGFVGPSL
jgi:hypothetical protein